VSTATPCDFLRSPTRRRLSRFLSHFFADPHVFTEDAAVVTNPSRGVCGARVWLPTIHLSSVAGRLPRRRRASLPVERQGCDPTVDLVEQSPRFGTADSAIVRLQLVPGDAFRETGE
jgi:hypothetical protein